MEGSMRELHRQYSKCGHQTDLLSGRGVSQPDLAFELCLDEQDARFLQ